jgi:hypothetical protein
MTYRQQDQLELEQIADSYLQLRARARAQSRRLVAEQVSELELAEIADSYLQLRARARAEGWKLLSAIGSSSTASVN